MRIPSAVILLAGLVIAPAAFPADALQTAAQALFKPIPSTPPVLPPSVAATPCPQP